MGADIRGLALYIPRARPRPGYRRLETVLTERSSEGLDERRRKLLFRAWRQGQCEIDLIVGRFAESWIGDLDEVALADFERLIEAPNADLYAWVVEEKAIPEAYDTEVLRRLRAFHKGAETPNKLTGRK